MYNLQPVTSSMLRAVGKEGDDLFVQFNNETIYKAIGAAIEFDAMMASPSIGVFFNRQIKLNYTVEKVEQ